MLNRGVANQYGVLFKSYIQLLDSAKFGDLDHTLA